MTLVMTPLNDSQKDLLIKLAEELHIKVEVIDNDSMDMKSLMKLSESSFAKEWDSEEDNDWDELLKPKEHVSKR
jgi:hypothetical protein